MAAKVVDASAMGALVFGEPAGRAIRGRLGSSAVFAPALIYLELANVCAVKVRRHPQQRDALWSAFREARDFGIEVLDIDHFAVLDLAVRTRLTAYDASYLWMARLLDAEIVTLDRELEAASRNGSWH